MAIKVNIPAGVASVTIDPLYQWDYGQVLEIESGDALSDVFEVHFSCLDMSDAIVRSCSSSSGCAVEVPNTCLEQSCDITAWIYEIDATSGRTLKTITIPIIERPRPNRSGEITENISNAYTEVITTINDVVEELKSGNIVLKKAETAVTSQTAQNANNANTADSARWALNASNAEYANLTNRATTAANAEKVNDLQIKMVGTVLKLDDEIISRKKLLFSGSKTVSSEDATIDLTSSVASGDVIEFHYNVSWGANSYYRFVVGNIGNHVSTRFFTGFEWGGNAIIASSNIKVTSATQIAFESVTVGGSDTSRSITIDKIYKIIE